MSETCPRCGLPAIPSVGTHIALTQRCVDRMLDKIITATADAIDLRDTEDEHA